MPNHRAPPSAESPVAFDVVDAARSDARLGPELATLRKIKKLTLEQLSQRTGLSVGFISQIERGKNRPSVTALFKLSRALGVPINWFFFGPSPGAADAAPAEAHVVRRARRRVIDFGDGVRDELLSPSLAGRLELLSCTFAPGAGVDASYAHDGEEAGLVVQGELELWVDATRYLLRGGDSFSFDSAIPHRYRNPSAGETIVVWALTPPSF